MPPRRARRFRAFCVGLPKTGTTSVGTIFENYRSAKVAGSSLERLGCDVREDGSAAEAARAFVLRRDAEEWLEMDPSSANWMILPVLKEQFPDSRFILTIRDCYSWCDSILNVLIGRTAATDFVESPDLFRRMFGCELDWFRDAETALSHCEPILERVLEFWAQQVKTAQLCASHRTLVIKTNEISSSLNEMAAFVGVPPETLLLERTHSRQTDRKFDMLRRVDRRVVETAFDKYSDSDFMTKYFPEATLSGFLGSRPRDATRRSPTTAARTRSDEPVLPSPPHRYPVGYWLSEAEAAASRGDAVAAERGLAEAEGQGLEPDEQIRAAAVRSLIAGPDVPEEAQGRADVGGATGHKELAEALLVIRGWCKRGVPQRLGYRLQESALRIREARCYAVLHFSGARGPLILEIGLRDALDRHWLASERFSLSYRREAPATLQSDQQLAQTLLDTIERMVRRSEVDGRTHERE